MSEIEYEHCMDELILYIENTQNLSIWASSKNPNTNKDNYGAGFRKEIIEQFIKDKTVNSEQLLPLVTKAIVSYNKEFNDSAQFSESQQASIVKELSGYIVNKLNLEGVEDWVE